MKLTRHELITHFIFRKMFHFWLIPSVEIDWEIFDKHNKWLHIYFAWLFWSVDLEWEEKK